MIGEGSMSCPAFDGVIRGIAPGDVPEELDRKIVNSKNPLALGAKRTKSTGTVVLPNNVSYGGRLGHRADVCPSPDEDVCKGCGVANPDQQHKCDPNCRLCGGRHFTAAKECHQKYQMPYLKSKSPAFAKGKRQLPEIAGRYGFRGSFRYRNHSPPVTPGRSRARSGSSVGQQMKKSTLSWADRVRGGGEAGPSRDPREPLPEQTRDAETTRLQKENTEVPVLVSDSAVASKRSAVSSKEESVSQTYKIKGMLATLTTSVQVALGDPKSGLAALADRIDALELLVIPSTTSTTPM
ncbi:hypothetical protein HPB49_005925 [Dermacentor silvarum]|uniref:Uncharacterized protein n=1 Tax=Dermacentor silvarum TaxID=543639 RepID=A0ACB8CW34_DERSI|nr:hypothetical protein HPB49_005925 [Dermacentor silvarum]